MSEEKKELKKELKKNECCKGKEKLSIEELDKVTGGSSYITKNLELPEVKPAPI